jgi:hypothetical protein
LNEHAGGIDAFMEDGHLTELAIGLYVDAVQLKTTPNLPEEVLLHVQECFECRDKVVGVSSFLKGVGYTPARAPRERVTEDRHENAGVWQTSLRVAAVILLIIIGAWGVNYLMTRQSDDYMPPQISESPVVQDTLPSDIKREPEKSPDKGRYEEPEDLYAENFKVNETLESFVGVSVRGDEIDTVISPRNDEVMVGWPRFAWKGSADEPLSLAIFNNSGAEIFRSRITGDRFVLERRLVPGLYYWKLEGKDELLHVGKFLVKSRGSSGRSLGTVEN